MSLHFTFYVNGKSIHHGMDIQRLDDLNPNPGPDAVYRYRASALQEDGINAARQTQVIVEHRYGDGAWELVRKALNKIHEEGW